MPTFVGRTSQLERRRGRLHDDCGARTAAPTRSSPTATSTRTSSARGRAADQDLEFRIVLEDYRTALSEGGLRLPLTVTRSSGRARSPRRPRPRSRARGGTRPRCGRRRRSGSRCGRGCRSGSCWIDRPLTSPALASSRGSSGGEVDHAEVEVDDEDPLAGVEDREAAAGGDDAGERRVLGLGLAEAQAVGVADLGAGGERRGRAPEGDDVVGELVGRGDLDEDHRAGAPVAVGLDPGARGAARSAPRRRRSARSRGRAGSGRRRAGSRRGRPRSRRRPGCAAAATAARRSR